jgi:hypothetical protein
MDAVEVIGGIFLLIIGVLAVAPLPIDGWFIWFPSDASMTTVVVVAAGFFIILGTYFVMAGYRSKKKSPIKEVVGGGFLLLSFSTFFLGSVTENEAWTTIFLILGVGFLVVGVVLVGAKTVKKV